jgi:hypothetical protein
MSDGQGLKDPLDWSSGDRYDQELNLTHKCSAVPTSTTNWLHMILRGLKERGRDLDLI